VLNICNMQWFDAINAEARARGLRVLLTANVEILRSATTEWSCCRSLSPRDDG
jgi:hypothetical protein